MIETAGGILHPAHDRGAGETAEIADGIDQRNSARRRAAGEEGGWQRPERRLGPVDPDRRHRHQHHRRHGLAEITGAGEAHRGHRQRQKQAETALVGAIGHIAPHQDADGAHDIGNRGDEPGLDIGEADALDDLRQEERQSQVRRGVGEVDEGEAQHPRIEKDPPHRQAMGGLRDAVFPVDGALQPVLLRAGQPRCIARPVRQHEEHHRAEDHRRQTLEQEQPLPAMQSGKTVHLHDARGQRRADAERCRDRHHEGSDDAGAIGGGKPVGQIQDDAGKEAGLRRAEQEAHHQETGRAGHEDHADRHDAPRHHDPRNPAPRADLLHDQVAGHFEEEIAPEEQSRAEPVDVGRQTNIFIHGQRREADIDAIDVGEEITQQ